MDALIYQQKQKFYTSDKYVLPVCLNKMSSFVI